MNKEKQAKKESPETLWDEAIRDAEAKIARLQAAIGSFKAHKATGIPWPSDVTVLQSEATQN